ncbi:MAG: apolipoprotein N-acyltransferase [Pseudomonadota bacterium]
MMLVTLALLLVSGVVQSVISPPWNLVFLHPVAWIPAFFVFARLRGRRALAAGWLVGAAATLAIFVWLPGTIARFGQFPALLAILVWLLFALATGFHVGLFAWAFATVRRVAGSWWPLAVAAWFCALEFLNPHLFGYLQGDAWYQIPRVFLASAVTGVSGISFLVVLCNAVVLQGIELRFIEQHGLEPHGLELHGGAGDAARRAWRRNLAVLAGLVLLSIGYSSVRLGQISAAEQEAPSLRIALIQPNHTIERRHELSSLKGSAFAEDLVGLSRQAMSQEADDRNIDVFVWPEGALRSNPTANRNAAALEFVRSTGAEVWTGADTFDASVGPEGVSHNSAFRIFGDGQFDRRYDKNILVPFGEYVPLRDMIPGFDRIRTVGHYEAGRESPKYQSGPARFVFFVCYEAIRSGFVRAAVDDDVNLMVNVTVDAWYGDSSEQSQHLMLVAVQSALHGMPLVRSTTTGISAFVDARGVLVAQAGNFTREALVRDVRVLRVPSLYSKWGDWFAWGCVLASVLMLAAAWWASRQEEP